MIEIKYCPSTLTPNHKTYSSSILKNMFFGKKVSHILDFNPPEIDDKIRETFRENSKSISVSGTQFKQSLRLEKNTLRLTQEKESGQYILKPIPLHSTFRLAQEFPANEHLTMRRNLCQYTFSYLLCRKTQYSP